MILLPIPVIEELRSFIIQLTSALETLKHGPVRMNGHQILTFHFSRPKIHKFDTFFQFSLTKTFLAASEMHEDNV